MTQSGDEPPAVEARIIDTATRMFAALGFDAVSIQMIADSAGVEPSTVVVRYGGKRGIYHAVMAGMFAEQRAYLQAAVDAFTLDQEGLVRLAMGYLDYCLAHPAMPALWMHRVLSDAKDLVEMEDLYAAPLLRTVTDAVRTAVGPRVDADMLVCSVVWSVHSFSRAGMLTGDGKRLHPRDPDARARFESYVRTVLGYMPVGLP